MKAVATAFLLVTIAGSALAQPCTTSPLFPGGDFDGPVRAMVTFDSSAPGGASLYAAGTFSRAGNTPAGGVIRWTGTEWAPIGGTFDGDVNALCVHDDGTGPHLFAGGTFRSVGGVPATLVSKWNGTSWVAAGAPIYGNGVFALASYIDLSSPALFVGGDMLRLVLNLPQVNSGLLMLRGTSNWSAAQSSGVMDMAVYALADYVEPQGGRALFAAGKARFPTGPNILRYTSGWQPPSNTDLNGPAYALATHNDGSGNKLYVGGDFSLAGGTAANRIARWNGSAWSAVGTGFTGAGIRTLSSIDLDGPFSPLPYRLYAGGDFSSAGGAPARNLASWNGQAWSSVGANDTVLALGYRRVGTDFAMFAGGKFSSAGGVPASHVAAFTAAGTQPLLNPAPGNAPSDRVRATVWFDDDGAGPHAPRLYVAGDFRSIGGHDFSYAATWDGSAWAGVPGIDAPIYALKVFDDGEGPALYAAANRDNAPVGTPNGTLYRLVNSQWVAQGQPLNGRLQSLEVYTAPGGAPALFGGGSFIISPSGSNVARWSGTSWEGLGYLSATVAGVPALAVFDDGSGLCLFVGAGSTSGSAVSRWNGSTWTAVSTNIGFGTLISSFAVYDSGSGARLYAAGRSLTAFEQHVARLENGAWIGVPNAPNDLVSQLTVFDDGSGPALCAGGSFTACGTVPALHLARWNGSAWSAMGSILPASGSTISCLVAADPDGVGPAPASLWVGGSFLSIDGVSSPNFAQLNNCSSCYPNCDHSAIPPILNVNDFTCFLGQYAAGDPYANCDGSTLPPVLNVGDFTCFANRFAAGCP